MRAPMVVGRRVDHHHHFARTTRTALTVVD
jgi:hypothetical protein